jgi:hypothetical protein
MQRILRELNFNRLEQLQKRADAYARRNLVKPGLSEYPFEMTELGASTTSAERVVDRAATE